MSPTLLSQDKQREIVAFAEYAERGEYRALTAASCEAVLEQCLARAGLEAQAVVLDVGCGSGTFTRLLQQRGYRAIGVDLCHALLAAGSARNGATPLLTGDVERLPVRSSSVDGVLLSGLIHHLPDPTRLARETYRVLKPGGAFMAFDPNRRNPFLWLYRDPSSPFYSRTGVSPNERPILAAEVARVFAAAGFAVTTDYASASYQHIASPALRWALPVYNALERCLFAPAPFKAVRAFVITCGVKPR